jgi:hypothetical protein
MKRVPAKPVAILKRLLARTMYARRSPARCSWAGEGKSEKLIARANAVWVSAARRPEGVMYSCANACRRLMAWSVNEAASAAKLSSMLALAIRVVMWTKNASATRVGSVVASESRSVLPERTGESEVRGLVESYSTGL